ncbi:Mu transposase C-terminal domain-containing protein [Parvibaculum sp.]|uniref:Mu transposase C-terminal domain-containing protein n=1 Tax=Parvibaculum sp. TaxID=2024848 RepID=UPI002730DB43|nr:Mu transposase C-terminal domain-containing protein [Parvibaculum sp.]MDP1627393.1 Mu transposase C-terminal domain-containing protein [Parvibaculum sp.]MDP2148572.1 Mu transposase C-terminal domain-containing protein [Parvibaculum sp.]MDP3327529.1 Mu transposase C-terminal domain-containing protein [Parvibaculum sp.]
MTGKLLAPSEKVELRGKSWVVVDVNEDGDTILQSSENGRYLAVSELELKIAYKNGDLKPTPGGRGSNKKTTDLLDLPQKYQEELQRRRDYLRLLQARTKNPGRDELERNIKIVGSVLGDPKSPSVSTIYRWKKDEATAKSMGDHPIPGYRRRGNRNVRITKSVQDIIRTKINEDYMNGRRLSLKSTWKHIVQIVDSENSKLPKEEQHTLPGIGAVRRVLHRTFSPYEICRKREGPIAADRKFRISGKSLEPDYPMQLVQIDHTVADQIGLDEDLVAILGRLNVSAASDVYSGMIVGLQVGFEPPSTASLFSLIRNMILPKAYVQERWPEIQTIWECDGPADILTIDRGRELLSKAHVALCGDFEMEVDICGARRPYQKGVIENFFGLLSHNFSRRIPGATFSNPRERGEYDSVKQACLAYTDIVRLLHQWVIEVHANQPRNEGEGRTRREIWNEGMAKRPHVPIRPITDFGVFMAGRAEPMLNGKGVRVSNEFYRSPDLELLRRRTGDKKVRVRFDPADMSEVHVFDAQYDQWLTAYNVDPLHHGQSLYQLRLERKARLGPESAAERALRSAKHEARFQEDLDAAIKRSKRQGAKRPKINARANGVGIQAHSNIGQFATHKKSSLPIVQKRAQDYVGDDVDFGEFRNDDTK